MAKKSQVGQRVEEAMNIPPDAAFEDFHDDRYHTKLELEIGDTFLGLFKGVNEFTFKGDICHSLLFLDAKTHTVISMSAAVKLQPLAAVCIPDQTWVKITRLEDGEKKKGQSPMKNFQYQTSGPKATPEQAKATMEQYGWGQKKKKAK